MISPSRIGERDAVQLAPFQRNISGSFATGTQATAQPLAEHPWWSGKYLNGRSMAFLIQHVKHHHRHQRRSHRDSLATSHTTAVTICARQTPASWSMNLSRMVYRIHLISQRTSIQSVKRKRPAPETQVAPQPGPKAAP